MSNPATVSPASVGDVTPATVTARGRLTEDWVAVVLGFVVIAIVLLLFQWKAVDLRNIAQVAFPKLVAFEP